MSVGDPGEPSARQGLPSGNALLCRELAYSPIIAVGPATVLQVQGELTIQQGLLMKGVRLVVPVDMRLAMLDKLHEGHQGVVKCRARTQCSVWWPGLSRQLEELVRNCTTCAKEHSNSAEPMIASDARLRPRQKVGTDNRRTCSTSASLRTCW